MGLFHRSYTTEVGATCTGSETLVFNSPEQVRIHVKQVQDDWNRYDHSHAYIPPAYKQDLPSHTVVKVDVRYGGPNEAPPPAYEPPPLPRREEHWDRRAYPVAAAAPSASASAINPQDDAYGRTAMELNKVRDVSELNFKPDASGIYKANVQGVFKNGFSKVFKEDPAFAQKLLGSDAVTLSEDRESIVLKRSMSAQEIQLFQENAAAIGKLKRGDLRRAHEIYDLEIHGQPQAAVSANTGRAAQPGSSQPGQGGASAAQQDEAAAAAASAAKQDEAAAAAAARKAQAEAAAAMYRPAPESHNASAHLSPQDKIAIAQVILEKLGYQLGPKGVDGLMGHHDPKGGFTGRAIEEFKKNDVGFAPPANAQLTDKTFDRLIQRYQGLQQGKDGIKPTGVLDGKTVEHLRADEHALPAKGVKVTHTIPLSAAVPAQTAQSDLPDIDGLRAKIDELTAKLPSRQNSTPAADNGAGVPLPTPRVMNALYTAPAR